MDAFADAFAENCRPPIKTFGGNLKRKHAVQEPGKTCWAPALVSEAERQRVHKLSGLSMLDCRLRFYRRTCALPLKCWGSLFAMMSRATRIEIHTMFARKSPLPRSVRFTNRQN